MPASVPGIQNSHRLTAVVDEQVLDLHAHEDVILQPRDVAVPDVEVPDGVLLLLDHVGIDLEKATNKPWFSVPDYSYSNLSCPDYTLTSYLGGGAAWRRGSVRASQPAIMCSILASDYW